MNLVDKVVSFFDPSSGLKRARERAAIDVINRGYDAARKDRRGKSWASSEYENTTNLDQLNTLKQRSIDLYKNNPYAFSAHKSIAQNTTGTGILPAISNSVLKEVWKNWAENVSTDFDEQLDFYGIQNLCTKTMSVQGECLVLRIKTSSKSNVPLELKVITNRFLDPSKDTDKTPTGGHINAGIEYNEKGKRIGYHIYERDPIMAVSPKSLFWKNEDVIHLFQVEEPGQSRGVPFGTPSMMSLRDFDDYSDAQLMRQKIAACFSVFVTDSEADLFNNTNSEDRLEKVEPGIIEHLPPGKSVTFASPPAAEGYGEYSRNVLTGISSGYGVSYESMTGDLSNVNFSSGRMGWLESQRTIESIQWFIIVPKLCKKVWSWFVEAAILSGKVSKQTPTNIEWTAPRRQMIDPVKETNGLLSQVRAGFISWQEAVRSLGYTPEEVLEEIQLSTKMFDSAGIKPKCDPRFDNQNDTANTSNDDTGTN